MAEKKKVDPVKVWFFIVLGASIITYTVLGTLLATGGF